MDTLDQNVLNKEAGELNGEIKAFLLETAKWAKFLSILGFIGLGIMMLVLLITMLAGATVIDQFEYSKLRTTGALSGGIGTFFALAILALYFFPIYYLYKAADGIQKGIRNGNHEELTSGFSNLKSHYKFIGIFTIIIVSIYILVFLFFMLVMAGR